MSGSPVGAFPCLWCTLQFCFVFCTHNKTSSPVGSHQTSGNHSQWSCHSDQSTGIPCSCLLRKTWDWLYEGRNESHIVFSFPNVLRKPTVDVSLFFRGHYGHQVSSHHTAMLLCSLPALTLAEVSIAETVKFIPARFTSLPVWKHHREENRTAKPTRVFRCIRRLLYWIII